jgi:anhydro-N-acetylmuramic acid kinase
MSKSPNSRRGRVVAGLMSGTSLDGIDCVILSIRRRRRGLNWKLLSHVHVTFPVELSDALRGNSDPDTSRIDEINDLNQVLPHYYADAVKRAARKTGISTDDIDLIGCHGQTVYHRPEKIRRYGKRFGATLQIGDPSTLSAITGIPVVGNFRAADVALGGEGAPLVPYADYLVYSSARYSRLMLNIGGIANFTYLERGGKPEDVIAFDTGPGNMVIDAMMKKLFDKPFDRNGVNARKGTVNEELFMQLVTHPFIHKKPPKSTGREIFGEKFIKNLMDKVPEGISPYDIITTVTEFTAWSVFHAFVTYVKTSDLLDELIVSGGGAKNRYILKALTEYFDGTNVMISDETGIPVEAKEAVCFAVLANETIDGRFGNLPSVTGSVKSVPLGVVAKNFRR